MKKHNEHLANILHCIGYSLLGGSLTGAVIVVFKLVAHKAEEWSRHIYEFAKTSWLYVLIGFVVLMLAALMSVWIQKKAPESKGGGIPMSEGILRGILSFRWLRTLLGTIAGSVISFICGLPVGSEGPAVLIGTSIGRMCGSVSKNRVAWDRYVMTGGAGAGFAVATGAPLSGVLFALEEIHKRFTPMLVLSASMAVLAATWVNRLLCGLMGMDPHLLELGELAGLDLSHMGYLLILSVIVALAVGIFDASISLWETIFRKIRRISSRTAKMIAVFVLTGVMGFWFADGIYSGHEVILKVLSGNQTALFLGGLLLVRLIMMLLVTGSGATGGIFIPTLAVGALVSALSAKLLTVLGMPADLFATVVLLGMCAFIGGTLRAPLTAIVLFVELTGQGADLFYVALVVFVVNFITDLLNQTSFYDKTLERVEEEQHEGKCPTIAHFEMTVSPGSFVVGKAVRDVMWPSSSVVLSITRANDDHQDMDNDGEKKLFAGDTVVLRACFYDEQEIRRLLRGLVGTKHEIIEIEV